LEPATLNAMRDPSGDQFANRMRPSDGMPVSDLDGPPATGTSVSEVL
jgi:hypothetical protein